MSFRHFRYRLLLSNFSEAILFCVCFVVLSPSNPLQLTRVPHNTCSMVPHVMSSKLLNIIYQFFATCFSMTR